MLHHISESCIDLKLGSAFELLLAEGTLWPVSTGPVPCDASLAVVVSTWCGHWLRECMQTDRTQELLFTLEAAG